MSIAGLLPEPVDFAAERARPKPRCDGQSAARLARASTIAAPKPSTFIAVALRICARVRLYGFGSMAPAREAPAAKRTCAHYYDCRMNAYYAMHNRHAWAAQAQLLSRLAASGAIEIPTAPNVRRRMAIDFLQPEHPSVLGGRFSSSSHNGNHLGRLRPYDGTALPLEDPSHYLIVFKGVNFELVPLMVNAMLSLQRIAFAAPLEYVAIALDEQAFAAMRAFKLPAWFPTHHLAGTNSTAAHYSVFGTSAFNALLKRTTGCLLELLERTRRHLITTDVDLVWLRDPLPWLRHGSRLACWRRAALPAESDAATRLNTGFMAIRPTNATRSFWARMLATCASWAYADDQFCLNALLLGPNRSATIRMPRDGEKWWTNNAANVTKASCDAAAGICPARPRLLSSSCQPITFR